MIKKKKDLNVIIVGIILILCVNSCYYDNMESLYPPPLNNKCDTINVTYSGTIKPFLSTYCLGCHSNANAPFAKNIRLDNYADVVTNADQSLRAITWSPGVIAMPQGASTKLDNCTVAQFQIWIKNGKPNN
jgi:hypothetical protein